MNFHPLTVASQTAPPEGGAAGSVQECVVGARLGFHIPVGAAAAIDVSSQSSAAENASAAPTTTQVSARTNYHSYISSHAWRNSPARLAELKAACFRCRLCNASADDTQLEVHHRTYERLGCEKVEDLTALCSQCHRSVTAESRRRLYSRGAPAFANIDVGNCRVPPFDPMPRGDWS